MTVHLYTDGGARGNPGPAAIGVVVKDLHGKILKEYNKSIGETTNNQAEYQALWQGLSLARSLGATVVHCFLDSELVVKQLNRQYKVKDHDLAQWFVKIWNLLPTFSKVSFAHIPREKNARADQLVNQALDNTNL